jgi:phosphate starvation-inducible PhoH-like protein
MKKTDNSVRVPQRDKLKGTLIIKPLPWTEKQQKFIEVASSKESQLIFISGPAGSAKTILATFVALELLNQKKISDIIYVRSAVESADTKLGYLPGELEDKIHYYGIPFLDKLEELLNKADIQCLVNEKRVQVFPINYVRGLSWNARAIIIDEAQNLTQKELITALTRIGKYSKCFVLADPMQSDINGKSGGFEKIASHLNDEAALSHGIHHFQFDESDIMRSELVKFLVGRLKFLTQTSPKAH